MITQESSCYFFPRLHIQTQAAIIRLEPEKTKRVKELLSKLTGLFFELRDESLNELIQLQENLKAFPAGRLIKMFFVKQSFPFSKLPLDIRKTILPMLGLNVSYKILEALDVSCMEAALVNQLNKDYITANIYFGEMRREDRLSFLSRHGDAIKSLDNVRVPLDECLPLTPNLKHLSVQALDETILSHIVSWNGFTNLSSLTLKVAEVQSKFDELLDAKKFDHLSFFNVREGGTYITVLRLARQLPNLTALDFSSMGIGDVQLEDILHDLPATKFLSLNFSYNAITSGQALTRKVFPSVLTLDLRGTPFYNLFVDQYGLDCGHYQFLRQAFPALDHFKT